MTHSGIAVDVLGAGLDRISREKQQAILTNRISSAGIQGRIYRMPSQRRSSETDDDG
jgi:hypothetical protein